MLLLGCCFGEYNLYCVCYLHIFFNHTVQTPGVWSKYVTLTILWIGMQYSKMKALQHVFLENCKLGILIHCLETILPSLFVGQLLYAGCVYLLNIKCYRNKNIMWTYPRIWSTKSTGYAMVTTYLRTPYGIYCIQRVHFNTPYGAWWRLCNTSESPEPVRCFVGLLRTTWHRTRLAFTHIGRVPDGL